MNQLVENIYSTERAIVGHKIESFSGSASSAGTIPLNKENKKEQEEKIDDRVVFSALEVGKILKEKIEPVSIHTNMSTLEQIFNQNISLAYVPVMDNSQIVGYIIRERFQAFLGQSQFHRDLYLKPGNTIKVVTDTNVIILDSHATLYEASRKLMSRDIEHLYDPFVVIHRGDYYGMSTVRHVMNGLNSFSTRNLEACASAQEAILVQPDSFRKDKVNLAYLIDEIDNLGGDLVYFNSLRKDLHLVALFDVSGKGLKASNMVMTIQSFFKASIELFLLVRAQKRNKTMLMRLINKLNRMVANNTPLEMYATGVILVLDTKNMVMDYYDFGHTPVYIIRNKKVKELPVKSTTAGTVGVPFFGIDPSLVVMPNRIRIAPNDKFFIHSDGLDESRSEQGEEYGEKRVKENLVQWAEEKPEEILKLMKQNLLDFRVGHRIMDDLSMVALCVK